MTGRMTFPFNIAAAWEGHWQGSGSRLSIIRGMLTACYTWIEGEHQGKAASFQFISNLHSVE